MVRILRIAVLALIVPTVFADMLSGAAPRYRVVDLHDVQDPSVQSSSGLYINNRGHVTGYVHRGVLGSQAFLWKPETGMQLLPPASPDGIDVSLNDFNNLDQIVGTYRSLGMLWDGLSAPTELTEITGSSVYAGFALNDNGQFLIGVQGGGGEPAFWSASSGVVIPDPISLGGEVRLQAINNDGMVAGRVDGDGTVLPLLWDVATNDFTILPTPTLDIFHSAGFMISEVLSAGAEDLNDLGDVLMGVGVEFHEDPSIGFLGVGGIAAVVRFADGRLVSLGDVPVPEGVTREVFSIPFPGSLNNRGQVVGMAAIFEVGADLEINVPYLWDERDGVQLVPDLLDSTADGWQILNVTDISDSGILAGSGLSPSGNGRAILLVPVPEPAALLLALLSASLIVPVLARGPGRRHGGKL